MEEGPRVVCIQSVSTEAMVFENVFGFVLKESADAFGNGEDPLSIGDIGEQVVEEFLREGGESFGVTGSAEATSFTREGDEAFKGAVWADETNKSILNHATSQESLHGEANFVAFVREFV